MIGAGKLSDNLRLKQRESAGSLGIRDEFRVFFACFAMISYDLLSFAIVGYVFTVFRNVFVCFPIFCYLLLYFLLCLLCFAKNTHTRKSDGARVRHWHEGEHHAVELREHIGCSTESRVPFT